MSSTISESLEMDLEPALKSKLRKITFHSKQFSSNKLDQWTQEHEERQNLFLKNICRKFANYEQQKIRQKSTEDIRIQLKQLKHKLKHTLSQSNIQKIMSQKQNKHEHYLDKVLKANTELVDIGKKYNKKINQKLSLFRENDQIGHLKNDYKIWYDSNKNNAQNSPIFHKMSRVLDKEKEQNTILKSQPLRKSMDESILTYHQSAYKRKKCNYNNSRSSIKKQ